MAKSSGGTGRSSRAEFTSAVKSGDLDKQARVIADELKAVRWRERFLPNKIQIGETEVNLGSNPELQRRIRNLR